MRVLLDFAVQVTEPPGEASDDDIGALRDVGLDDEQVLMATLTAVYFNFVNRVVLTLGVDLEAVHGEYRY